MDWNGLLSRVRLGQVSTHAADAARTDYQRDFDRIVFSSAFRRLHDKTQVFPLARNDYVRTRLTHSLEVSCVGRSLGTQVGEQIISNYSLSDIAAQDFGAIVAAACLAHDIGNPPFGHAGEDAIRLWFQSSPSAQACLADLGDAERQDFLRFEGNAQGFRLVTRLQSPDNPGGMQLTCATLGAASKYPRASWSAQAAPPGIAFSKFGFFQAESALFAQLAEHLGLVSAGAELWYRHPLSYLVEAADDICYLIIDIEDAFQLQLISYEQVLALLMPILAQADQSTQHKLSALRRSKERIEYLRAKAIGILVQQVVRCFMDHQAELLTQGLEDELITLIPAANALSALQDFAQQNVYISAPVVEVGTAGFEVLGGLLEAFVGAVNDVALRAEQASAKSRMLLRLLPEQFVGPAYQPLIDPYQRVLAITDFVSGMTDSYAVSLYRKITGMSLSRI